MRFVYEGLLVIQFALSYGWCWIELEMPFIIFSFLVFTVHHASCIWHGYWWTICPVEILIQWFLWLPRVTPSTPLSYRPSPTGPHGMITARWVLYIYMSMLFTTRNLNCNCMFLIKTSVIDIVTKFVYKGLHWSFISQMLPLCCDMQVGGWSQIYKGLTLVTITGAGHEVPLHRPREAFILFRSFLENKPMPR